MSRTISIIKDHFGTIIVVLMVSLGVAGVWSAVENAKESAKKSQCHANMYSLGFALRNYHYLEGSFPPAYTEAPDGTPLSSWRVLVLRDYGMEQFFDQYDLKMPWDDNVNYELAQRDDSMSLFACPSGPNYDRTRSAEFHASNPRLTNYVAITGPGTIFPGENQTISTSDITDGAENTLLLVEIANSDIHWAEPRDLQVEEMSFKINDPTRPSISSPHEYGPGVIFADGLYYRLPHTTDPRIVKALITIDGGEEITRDEIFREGHSRK